MLYKLGYKMKKICKWAKTEIEIKYHNDEWCKVCHDEKKLFEMLILENMQAGLSWRCVLNKREAMREAFDNFDYKKIANYNEKKIASLLEIINANKFMEVQKEFGSFDKYIWHFTNNKVVYNKLNYDDALPSENELSKTVSKDLIKRGFKFVGSIIIYSYLEAIGIINDHYIDCPFK